MRICLIIILLLLINHFKSEIVINLPEVEIIAHKSYILNKDSVEHYPVAEVMAAIAYHECYNLSKDERFLIMEAFYNRVEDDFNNNGKTVKKQLLAPKQFTGLWKYNSQQFKFDSKDSICIENLEMAKAVISGYRIAKTRIYYWSSKKEDCNTKHGKWMQKIASIKNNKFSHFFY